MQALDRMFPYFERSIGFSIFSLRLICKSERRQGLLQYPFTNSLPSKLCCSCSFFFLSLPIGPIPFSAPFGSAHRRFLTAQML